MKNFKKLIKEALTPHYLRESVNDNEFPDSFTVKDTLHYTPKIDGTPIKLLKGTYFLRIDVESGDIVSYEGEDHTVMRIDNGKIYIRPNEESAILGKKDTFWVEPKDLVGNTAVYFNQAFKSEVEIDNVDIFNFKRLEDNIELNEYGSNWEKKLSKKAVWVDNYVPKVGDELIMAYQGSTVRNKTGVVTSVSDDMAQVDFGGGDSYGIMFSRIKADKEGNKYINEDLIKETSWDEIAMKNYGVSYDELNYLEQEWVRDKMDRDRGVMEGNKYINEDLIKEFQRDGGNYRSSYQHRQPKEQLTTTEDYELFMEMFPRAEASRILMDPKRKELYDKHLEWTKEYDNNNTFVHMQYHEVEHEGEKYKAHQEQFYNGNYDDFRNPRFTELMISKDGKRMGTYLVDTGEYIEDLKNLEVKNKVSESLNEDIVDDKAKVYWLQKLKSGEIDTLPDNPRMEYLRHAMRDQLAQDKEQLRRERGDLSKSSSLIGRQGTRNFMDEAEDRINELFGIGGPSHRDIKNKAARERSANKTANYHDLLKYYQFGIARVPRHKREKATVPQAMHDRYGQEVWDILKKAYPNKGLSDTPPSDWRDSADELIMVFGDEGNFEKTIYNPFYDIYAKLGPTDSHKKQLGIEEVVRGDDFRFIDIKDLHFEIDPNRLEDMKIEFGAKMGGITNREKIGDAEYELRRFRKSINYGNGTSVDPFIPDSYDAINSKLVNGPHAKKRPKVNWNDRKYEEWIESVAAHGGVDHAYDMAQNAKQEQGLIDWVKKNRLGFGDVTALERIQYDIEALAESATGGGPVNPINLTIDDEGASDAALDSEVNHMFEEDLAENTSNWTPAIVEKDKKYFVVAMDSKGKFIQAIDRRGLDSKQVCGLSKEEILKRVKNLEKDLSENTINEDDTIDYNVVSVDGNLPSFCAIKESKEFNFNKMIKEALTPNILK